ncbi:galactosyl transferase GMA12/MNN10 family-domain-containing protein [Aspergillus venezuelensis]
MSLMRSPSPRAGGGSSPSLSPGSGRSTPRNHSHNSLYPPHSPSQIDPWLAAKAKSDEVRGYPAFSTTNGGFFARSKRQIAATLPRFRARSKSPKGVANKKEYAKRWGYELETVNMLAKKRYSHEWREGWEKVDILRDVMRKYPDADWFWWLDLNTYIMEHSYSLQSHIFDRLSDIIYRDINEYNPLNITHPPTQPYLDDLARFPEGDADPFTIHFLLSQDCGGFNLGSFFVHRSLFTERLLDIWWDPLMYEQRHMQWEHKEQDALEYIYENQPWVRSSVAFVPQRYINSFPPGACGDELDPSVHYLEDSRDFVVNMAGCDYGRDCWNEMYLYREYSKWLNRSVWERVRDTGLALYYALFGFPAEDGRSSASQE